MGAVVAFRPKCLEFQGNAQSQVNVWMDYLLRGARIAFGGHVRDERDKWASDNFARYIEKSDVLVAALSALERGGPALWEFIPEDSPRVFAGTPNRKGLSVSLTGYRRQATFVITEIRLFRDYVQEVDDEEREMRSAAKL